MHSSNCVGQGSVVAQAFVLMSPHVILSTPHTLPCCCVRPQESRQQVLPQPSQPQQKPQQKSLGQQAQRARPRSRQVWRR